MRMLHQSLALALLATSIGFGASAFAQDRSAISPELSPEEAAAAFEEALIEICLPAISEGIRAAQLPAEARSLVQVNRDPAAREEVGALPEETVWDVTAAMGVVRVHETQGRCTVSAYGPPAAATLSAIARDMAEGPEKFERLASTPGRSGLAQSLYRKGERKRVQVVLDGSEPGMPGHSSRFSVMSATVFATPER
jgi:hypothetical protein